jgi:phosphoesterase RecJ-like protein
VASLLYCGIHGDTAGFSLPNTSADCLSLAARLVQAGADVTHIGEQLCRSQARPDFELLRRVYDHTTVVADGHIAYSYLSHGDIVESQCSAEDIDDQVSIPRALAGVRIAILFSEGEPGVVRVNLRGEGRTSVIEIAQAFGGGGHTQSAGIRVRNKPLQQVIQDVIAVASRHLVERG